MIEEYKKPRNSKDVIKDYVEKALWISKQKLSHWDQFVVCYAYY